MDISTGRFKRKTLNIDAYILALIAKMDEFKGAWRALGNMEPERLFSLCRVATIESIGPFTRVKGSKLFNQAVDLYTGKQLGWLLRYFGQMQGEALAARLQ